MLGTDTVTDTDTDTDTDPETVRADTCLDWSVLHGDARGFLLRLIDRADRSLSHADVEDAQLLRWQRTLTRAVARVAAALEHPLPVVSSASPARFSSVVATRVPACEWLHWLQQLPATSELGTAATALWQTALLQAHATAAATTTTGTGETPPVGETPVGETSRPRETTARATRNVAAQLHAQWMEILEPHADWPVHSLPPRTLLIDEMRLYSTSTQLLPLRRPTSIAVARVITSATRWAYELLHSAAAAPASSRTSGQSLPALIVPPRHF
ncbi:MAG: hypothetical protein MHM6MM_009137 [Cercozoa sp. M6MM]